MRRGLAVVVMLGISLVAPLWAAAPTEAQEWSRLQPEQGPPGTKVVITGNLIGCYYSGPGMESSTWGLPDQVVFYWNSSSLTQADAQAFATRIRENPTDRSGLQAMDSHSFGEAGWSLEFTVPDGPLGPHYGVLSFEPGCNYKSVEFPNGNDPKPTNAVMSFCVTERDQPCQSPVTSIEGPGQDIGGGFRGTGHGTATFTVMDREIRRDYTVAAVTGGIAIVLGGVVLIKGGAAAWAWWAARQGGTRAVLTGAARLEAARVRRLLAKKIADLTAEEYAYLLKRGLIKVVEKAPPGL